MNFSSYFVLSTLVVAGVIAHAYVAHEQFYPAVVYLSTNKMCLAVTYNFAFALFLLFGKLLLKLFIGTLRDLEVEQLVDSGRGFLADTILFLVFYAPTIDNREVGTVYLIQYICCVIFMKVFHLTTQIRVSHMFEVGVPRFIVNAKLVALMGLLLSLDVVALQYFYSVASRSSTFFTWILFEALTMSTVVLVSICKYTVHMADLRLDNGWPGKSVCLFYIDLVHDVVSMTLFLVFMLTFFVQNPSRLPIYMMADVIQVARKLAQRLRSFRRYRRIALNMEARFPDASDEEIEQNEHCVICRDSLFEGSKPKKLPCNHIFHIDCLRSWLVMQQVCPTCRAEIPPDGPPCVHAPQAPSPPAAGGDSPAAPAPSAAAAQAAPSTGSGAAAAAGGATGSSDSSSSGAAAGGAPQAVKTQSSGAAGAAPQDTSAGVFGGAATATQAATPVSSASATASVGAGGASSSGSAMPGGHRPGLEVLPPEAAIFGSALAALPPMQEIVESLARAEEVAKFLRQQAEFWMEQCRQAERAHAQATGAAGVDMSGFLSAPYSLLVGAGAASPSTASAPAAAGLQAAAPVVPSTAQMPADAVGMPLRSTSAPVAMATALEPVEELRDGEKTPPPLGSPTISAPTSTSGLPEDQLAELRRLQKEQWERKRTSNSSLSGTGSPQT